MRVTKCSTTAFSTARAAGVRGVSPGDDARNAISVVRPRTFATHPDESAHGFHESIERNGSGLLVLRKRRARGRAVGVSRLAGGPKKTRCRLARHARRTSSLTSLASVME